jgi:predicted nucleotidyltransferase
MKKLKLDSTLKFIVSELRLKYHCHTAILYGSRARGDATKSSDYDVLGVTQKGRKFRIAKKKNNRYLDVFIYPEKDLKRLGDRHLYMREGVVLFEKNKYGARLLKRLEKVVKRDPRPLARDEIEVKKVWAKKMLERASRKDVEGNYRRVWLQYALLEDYFLIRRQRYFGPKVALKWLSQYDAVTFELFDQVLRNPSSIGVLKKLVLRAYDDRKS